MVQIGFLRPYICLHRPSISPLRPKISPLRPQINSHSLQDEQKSPCAQQEFVPIGVAALLPLTQSHNHAKQGIGFDSHLLLILVHF